MSLIPHSLFSRALFDTDPWLEPESLALGLQASPLDVFDPFDELDRTMGRHLSWLNMPEFLKNVSSIAPMFPKKFRVTADISGFSPNSIKTEISDDKKRLIIRAREGEEKKAAHEDYSIREFRKSYNLPENAQTDKMISFVTANDKLVVEVPLQEAEQKESLLPRIVEGEGGTKQLSMNLNLPQSIDPSKIKVTCKDRDLIVHAEDKQENPDSFSQISYYSRTTLPENTDFKQLKCHYDQHKLSINAPINPATPAIQQPEKSIPIELQGEMIEHANAPSTEKRQVEQPQQEQQQPPMPQTGSTQQQQQQQQQNISTQSKLSESQNIPIKREV